MMGLTLHTNNTTDRLKAKNDFRGGYELVILLAGYLPGWEQTNFTVPGGGGGGSVKPVIFLRGYMPDH